MVEVASVGELGLALQRFSWPDYLVFMVMLALCALIGIYFGYCAPGKQDEAEYLMGGRRMLTLPIALSLVASHISGITLLGLPTEVYVYGTQILFTQVGTVIWAVVFCWAILPVFHDLQLMTLYQYLEMRFDKRIRLFGSMFYTISLITWLPIVIYVPALAFNQVTGVNVHIITPAVCSVCVFYTCVGGMKAVVWTDVVQTISMFGCIVLVMILGTANVGGPCIVFQRAMDTGRLEPPVFDMDPLVRQTLWGTAIGGLCNTMVSCGLNQSMMQRYLALPTKKHAMRSVWLFAAGVGALILLCGYCGLLTYATYHDCDPVTTKLARAKDQLLPLLVMDTLGLYPGLPGLFVAGVFSAALSSLSTGLNSMAAVVVEDFWRPTASKPLTERGTNIVMRAVVVVFGAICVSLVFVVEKLGVVLQLSSSLGAITNGPMLAVFVEAMFLPVVNATGCLAGAAAGLAFMSWLVLGAQHTIATGHLTFPEKAVSVEGCTYAFNATTPVNSTLEIGTPMPLWIFRISYQWYSPLGVVVSLVVALVVSLIWRSSGRIDARLVSPLVRRFVSDRRPPVPGQDAKAAEELKIMKENGHKAKQQVTAV